MNSLQSYLQPNCCLSLYKQTRQYLASYPLVCKFNRTFKSQDSILHQIVLNQPFNTYLVPTCFQLPTLMLLGRQFLWFVARMLLFQDHIKKKQAKDEMSNHVPSQCLQQILDQQSYAQLNLIAVANDVTSFSQLYIGIKFSYINLKNRDIGSCSKLKRHDLIKKLNKNQPFSFWSTL